MMTRETTLDGAGDLAYSLAASGEGVSVECIEGVVPPYTEAALVQLYGNLFSTLAHRRAYCQSPEVNAYVVRAGGRIVALWLYQRIGAQIRVLNEGIVVDEDQVERFARTMFARYPAVAAVCWHAVRPQLRDLSFPHQRYNCLEDMVLELPPSTPEYLAKMGKSTRAYVHRYLNKLRREQPGVRFDMIDADAIDADLVHAIIALNRARMAHKGKVSINDDRLAAQIAHLAMECGVVGTLTIDGKLVAGTINYQVRDNYFLEVIAHDPAYNRYRLGTLCCYLTVCECIARGGSEYHFLWGQDEYKSRLLGKQRDLDELVVYRSRASRFLHPGIALTHAQHAWERRARLRLRELRAGVGLPGRVLQGISRWRNRD